MVTQACYPFCLKINVQNAIMTSMTLLKKVVMLGQRFYEKPLQGQIPDFTMFSFMEWNLIKRKSVTLYRISYTKHWLCHLSIKGASFHLQLLKLFNFFTHSSHNAIVHLFCFPSNWHYGVYIWGGCLGTLITVFLVVCLRFIHLLAWASHNLKYTSVWEYS